MPKRKSRLDRIEEILGEREEAGRRLDARLDRISAEVGKIGNSQGYFAEGIVAPSIPRLLRRAGIEVSRWGHRQKSRINGQTMEIDIIAQGSRTADHGRVVIALEVSSLLVPKDIEWALEKLPKFFEFYPEYRGADLLAGVAGMQVHQDGVTFAERQGLIVLGPGEEFARWMNGPGFVPKVWRPA
jgi:hypothetical protein